VNPRFVTRRFTHVVLGFGALLAASNLCAQSSRETRFAERVSQQNLLRNVRTLVSFGNRFGGSPSGDSAAAWVAGRFRSARLESEVVEDDEMVTYDDRGWSLRVVEPRSLRKIIKNAWLGPYSPACSVTRARLVYLEDASALGDVSVDSAVILTPSWVDNKAYGKMVREGALAVCTFAPATKGFFKSWAMISSLPAREDNERPLYSLSFANGMALKQALADTIPVTVEFSSRSAVLVAKPKTVIAEIPGESQRYILVCAHGDADSGGPGADDNASGMSGVLELARVMNGMVRDGSLAAPLYGIRFAVWGAEYHSAFAYVHRHRKELDSIVAVINFDEIGTGSTRDCLYFESNDVPHNEGLLRTLESIGQDYVGKKGFWKEATTNPSQGGTDSYVFLPDGLSQADAPSVEIPSTTIFTAAWDEPKTMAQTKGWTSKAWKGDPDSVAIDYSAYYHSSLDVPKTTTEREPYNMLWAVRAAGIALLRLAWK
jgi:hypothetical protein